VRGRLVGRGVRAPCCQPWRWATFGPTRLPIDPCPPTVRAGKGGSPRIRAATRAAESSRRTTSAGSCARARCSPAARCCRARGSSTSTAPFASACSGRGRASSRSTSSSAAIGAPHPSFSLARLSGNEEHAGGASAPPPLPTPPPPLHIALSRCVCYTGSTKTAGSRSKRGGPRPAPCAGARSVAARRAPRARLRSRATWPDVAPQLHLPAPVVAEL
jgi:hypothetical protein